MESAQLLVVANAAAALVLVLLISVRNPWAGVLVFVFARVSVDGLGVSATDQGAILGPATLVGIAFIGYAGIWFGFIEKSTRRPASGITRAFYIFCVWAFISAAFSPVPSAASIAATKLVAGVLMFALLEQALHGHPRRARQLLITVIASAILPGLIALYQGLTGTGDLTETPGFNRVYGTTVHPGVLAIYLVMVLLTCVALAARRTEYRSLYLFCSAIVGLLIFWTYTRSAWLVAAVGVVLVLVRLNKWLLGPILAGLASLPFVNGDVAERFADLSESTPSNAGYAGNSLQWRFQYWDEIMNLGEHARLTGVGLDNVQRLSFTGLRPHNLFVQTFVELGAVGLGLLILVITMMARHLALRRRSAQTDLERTTAALAVAVATSMFVISLVTNPLTSTMLWWYMAATMTYGFRDLAAAPEVPQSAGPVSVGTEP